LWEISSSIRKKEMDRSDEEELSMRELKETVMFLLKQVAELKGVFSKTSSVSGSSSGPEARLEPKKTRSTPLFRPQGGEWEKMLRKWSVRNQCSTTNPLNLAQEVSSSDMEVDLLSLTRPMIWTQVVL